jgi:hypothetical protein
MYENKQQTIKHIRYSLQNSGGVFSEGVQAPQAAQHTITLLGDPKTNTNILKLHKKQILKEHP